MAKFKVTAKVGNNVKGDEWSWGSKLNESDGFKDSSYPGCEFRLSDDNERLYNLGVNVKVTGSPKWNGFNYESRVKIEVPGDGEPSQFFGGVLYHTDFEN